MRRAITPPKQTKNRGSAYSEFPVFNFGGGLNNKYAPTQIADNQSPDLMNVNFDQFPAIYSRSGYTALNAAQIDGNPIVSLMAYFKSNGSKFLLATSGTSVYKWTGSSWAAIKSGLLGNGQRFSYQVYQDSLYMVNGIDGLMKWDGTTFSTVAGAPNGKYLKLFKNHMFMCGDPGAPNTLYFSDLGAPESWPALDIIAENTNDGDMLNGLQVFKDTLIAFKERTKFMVRGSDPANYINVGPFGRGTVSHFSAVVIASAEIGGMKRDVLMYLARDGVYAFDGVQDHLMSDNIQGSVNLWNQQYLAGACAVDYGHKYWLSVPEGTVVTNSVTYFFDYIHQAWGRYSIAASCFVIYQDPVKLAPTLYSGDTSKGIVYQQDTGNTDNGATIDAYFWTKDFDLGNPAHFKRFKGLFMFAPKQLFNYAVSVTYNVDFGKITQTVTLTNSSGSQWGTMKWGDVWGSANTIVSKTTNIPGMGRYVAFKIEHDDTNLPWAFYGLLLRYLIKARMG